MSDLKERIERAGQRYVDEPILVLPKIQKATSAVEAALAAQTVIGHRPAVSIVELPVPVTLADVLQARPKMPIVVGHERVRLRWMKPDGKGGLVPK